MNETDDDEPKLTWKEQLLAFKKWAFTKSGKITLGTTIGLLLLTLLIMKACEPKKGSILFGICSAFAEQNVAFPETMKNDYVEQYSSGVRVYYHHIDAFGQYKTEFVECTFEKHPQKGLMLKAAIYNTVKEITEKTPLKNKGRLYQVEQQYIDRFNASSSPFVVQQSEPDLTLPVYEGYTF